MIDPTIIVAGIMGGSAVVVAVVNRGIKRAGTRADDAVEKHVRETTRTATAQAEDSARQVGIDVGGVVSAAITAAVEPVSLRLALVEGEVRTLRGDLVPVAVADRGIVLEMVADGLVHHGKVTPIPDSVAPLYPHHLRSVPRPPESEETP